MAKLILPEAPGSIQKGVPLKLVLGKPAITQLGKNLKIAYKNFEDKKFAKEALKDIEPLSIKERGLYIAEFMKKFLPDNYSRAIQIILASLTPPLKETSDLGLSGMFYMPHVAFIEKYGLDKEYNGNKDPFDLSMKAQYEITKRFTSEFSIRPFIIDQQDRVFKYIHQWIDDTDPHVRRLCTEGPRPRLPWAAKIPSLVKDPTPSIPILEKLKDDEDLYVRRSVANHVGDIAKDHLDLALDLCEKWLDGATKERKWVIRHAVRHPAKKEIQKALDIRKAAK